MEILDQESLKKAYIETGELPKDSVYCLVVTDEAAWDEKYDIDVRRHARYWYNFLRKRIDAYFDSYAVVRASEEQKEKIEAFLKDFRLFHARLDVEFDDESDHIVSTETKYTEKDYEEGDVFIFSEDGEILGMARSSGKVIYNHHPISTNTLYTEGFLPGVVCESCGGEKPKDIDYDIFDFRCPVCKERKTYRK